MLDASKKIISIFVILILMFNLFLPTITFAEGETVETENQETESEEITRNYEIKTEEEWDISENGDGSVIARWTLKDKTLRISGKGKMKNWTYEGQEYSKYKAVIEHVIIENGITNIGKYAFDGFLKITNIDIPNSVTNIGRYGFYGCNNLTSINIPEGVTEIEDDAFLSCKALGNINLPNSITSIRGAFRNCESLISINIPSNVNYLASDAFEGSYNLTSINVDKNNQKYVSIDGVVYRKNMEEIICYPSGRESELYVIDSSVTKIGTAFKDCDKLKGIKIPEGVTTIENKSFQYCDNLTSIEIPNSVTSIEEDAFEYCESLTRIEIPDSVTNIGNSAFSGCSSLTSIEIPNSVTSIGEYAFYKCSSLTSIKIPNSITSIEKSTFYSCDSLENVEITTSVTSIGENAFGVCSSLESIEIPSSVTSIGKNAISGCIICQTNSEAHKYAEENKKLYILKDNVNNTIGNEYEIKQQEEWDISKYGDQSVIAKWTYNDRTLRISGNEEMKSSISNEYKKYKRYIEKVVIENNVSNIASSAFEDFTHLKSIEIPSSVEKIGDRVLKGCVNLININVNENNQKYTSIEGVLYTKDLKKIIVYPASKEQLSYTINNNVVSIEKYGFYGCKNLTEIIIPESITYIESDTFGSCKNLKNIKIPSSVTGIGAEAFYGCISLTSIEIPEGVTRIVRGAFRGCKSLTSIKIPNSVTSIGIETFSYCTSLTSIKIPEGVTSIGSEVFENCVNLKSIEIPSTVISFDLDSFRNCINLKSIIVDNNNPVYASIDGVVYTKDLKELVLYPPAKEETTYIINNNVTKIRENAFIESFNSININNERFYGQNNLEELVVSNCVTDIPENIFKNKARIICGLNSKAHRIAENNKRYYIFALLSDKYSINVDNISNISPKTKHIDFLKNITTYSDKIKLYNKNHQEIANNNEVVKTGDIIVVDNSISYELGVIGDVNSDGISDTKDMLKINKHRLGKEELQGVYLEAGDVTGDGKVDTKDMLKINKVRLGKESL